MSDVLLPLVWNGSTLAIPRASATRDGYLSQHDFILFSGGELVPVTSFNTRTGEVILLEDDVLAALGYAPLDRHGDTMTGPLILAGDSTNPLAAATRQFVLASVPAGTFRVSDYGASGSQLTFTGTVAAASKSLVVNTAAHDFKVGQGICVLGAGTVPTINGNVLVTTITAISGANITLQDAASSAATNQTVQHDDTLGIQATIDAAWNAGNGTVILQGYHRINKGFNDFNSILKIPHNDYHNAPISICLKGEVPTNWLGYGGPPSNKGVILKTDLIGSSDAFMLSCGVYGNIALNQSLMNATSVWVDSLSWRSYDNPQIGAIDLGMAGIYAFVRDVDISADVELLTGSQPTHGTIGLRMPGCNACVSNRADNVTITNYGIGMTVAEVFIGVNVSIMRCLIGLQVNEGIHLVTGRFLLWQCPTMVYFSNQPGGTKDTVYSAIDLVINFEFSPGGSGYPPWATTPTGRSFYDPNDVAVGNIAYLGEKGSGNIFEVTYTGCSRVNFSSLSGPTTFGAGRVSIADAHIAHLAINPSADSVTAGAADSAGSGYRQLRIPNGEKVALWNGGAGIEYPFGNSLDTGLVSFWKLNEASGDAVDSKGANNLTDTGSCPSVAGKIATARGFNGTTQYFLSSSSAGLSPANTDFTISCWVYLTDISVNSYIISKTGGADEYIIQFDPSGVFQFTVYSGSYATVSSDAIGIAVNTWYFLVAWRDATAAKIYIQLNNGTIASLSCPAPAATAAPFLIGSYTQTLFMKGRIDAVGYWNRLLT
jgi:Concanavalin A-like lectin/glucanases superfamily